MKKLCLLLIFSAIFLAACSTSSTESNDLKPSSFNNKYTEDYFLSKAETK